MKAIGYILSLIVLAAVAAPRAAFAQELVWAADAEGGAPYTFPDPRNPAHIIGFEVDLADALARRMGRKPRFVQNQWDGLVPGLERGEYEAVINGLEITAERAQRINFRILISIDAHDRAGDNRVERAETSGLTVGVLEVTFAERYVQDLGNEPSAVTTVRCSRLSILLSDGSTPSWWIRRSRCTDRATGEEHPAARG
jgi:polar amino acid transport system substrate-binding protein